MKVEIEYKGKLRRKKNRIFNFCLAFAITAYLLGVTININSENAVLYTLIGSIPTYILILKLEDKLNQKKKSNRSVKKIQAKFSLTKKELMFIGFIIYYFWNHSYIETGVNDLVIIVVVLVYLNAKTDFLKNKVNGISFKSIRMSKIDKMSGEKFEEYLEYIFRKLDYKVFRTQLSGDYGADLVIEKDGVRTVVQAKRYSANVGLSAVQEVVSAKKYYECKSALVVTNSYYTKSAKELAKVNKVMLYDRNWLENVSRAVTA